MNAPGFVNSRRSPARTDVLHIPVRKSNPSRNKMGLPHADPLIERITSIEATRGLSGHEVLSAPAICV
jgi:hypothetical protein